MTKDVIMEELIEGDEIPHLNPLISPDKDNIHHLSQFSSRKKDKKSVSNSIHFESLITPPPYHSRKHPTSIFNKAKKSRFAPGRTRVRAIFHYFLR
jgi:hypothetical protein